MLFKKTIVVWADDEAMLNDAVDDAVRLIREGGAVAFGIAKDSYEVADPEIDPDFDESVESLLNP